MRGRPLARMQRGERPEDKPPKEGGQKVRHLLALAKYKAAPAGGDDSPTRAQGVVRESAGGKLTAMGPPAGEGEEGGPFSPI